MTTDDTLPKVTIVTPTIGRKRFFQLPLYNFRHFDYPEDKLEWIIIDEGPVPVKEMIPDDPRIKYYYFSKDDIKNLYTKWKDKLDLTKSKMKSKKKNKKKNIRALLNIHKKSFHKGRIPLGMKRNLCASYATGEIIVHMDDDDYYPPGSIRTRINAILSTNKLACACTTLNNYYPKKFISFGSIPDEKKPYERQFISASLAYLRTFWIDRKFDNQDINEEGARFLRKRGGKVNEILPESVIVAIIHKNNYIQYPELKNGDSNGWHFKKLDEQLFTFIGTMD